METLDLSKSIHGFLGILCLLTGIIAVIVSKKTGAHTRNGKVFYSSLILLYVAILPHIIVKTNVFMLAIGWIAIAAATEGWRALLRFKCTLHTAPTIIDYAINLITVSMGIMLIGFGVWIVYKSQALMGCALLFFGWLGISLSYAAYKRWNMSMEPKRWLVIHIQLMTGSLSAAITAFVVLQFSGKVGSFEWLLWIAPTLFMIQVGKREIHKRNLT